MERRREPATPCAAGRNALRGGRLTPLLCSSSVTSPSVLTSFGQCGRSIAYRESAVPAQVGWRLPAPHCPALRRVALLRPSGRSFKQPIDPIAGGGACAEEIPGEGRYPLEHGFTRAIVGLRILC